MRRATPLLAAAALLAGCQEELTVPGGCPDLCPGGQPQIRDTVLVAAANRDSTFVGYSGWSSVPFLLVSDGLEAGETRTWYRFDRRPDSVFVSSISEFRPYTVDSVAVELPLAARDSTVSGLTLYYHHLPLEVDTLATLAWVDERLTDATLIDSLVVPDSVVRGTVRLVLTGEALERFARDSADTGVVALGLRLRANEPTGLRLAALASGGVALYTTYVQVDVADTASRRQQLTTTASMNGFVREQLAPPEDPTLHYVGWLPSARTFLRFELPEALRNPRIQVVRATLEVEPEGPLVGLRNDPAELVVYGLNRDFGAKSTPLFLIRGGAPLPVGGSAPIAVNVFGIVEVWRFDPDTPTSFVLLLSPEGGTFQQPVFRSTRSPSGAPRLRLTYVLPSAVEQP